MSQRILGALARPGGFDAVQTLKDTISGILPDLGVTRDLFTARASELDDSTGVLRWQYSTTYEWGKRDQSTGDTEIGEIQFRTTIYTVTDPSDEVKNYLTNTTHHRLRALFETTRTYDGYISGFNPIRKTTNTENAEPVGQDEIPATGLGVPTYSVEIYDIDDGSLLGYSKGYSLDFGANERITTTADAPNEVWRMSDFNDSRGDYEIKPRAYSNARKRAKNAAGKVAYINGMPIGEITSRGTVWLKKQYVNPDQNQYRSRSYITSNTGTPYQALSPGSKLYKVNEDDGGVYFSTTEPQGFDAVDPDDVDPDATGRTYREEVLALRDDNEPTEFVITEDEAISWALGRYDAVTTRTIDRGTDFTLHPRQDR